jgi:hypothetical protein
VARVAAPVHSPDIAGVPILQGTLWTGTIWTMVACVAAPVPIFIPTLGEKIYLYLEKKIAAFIERILAPNLATNIMYINT